MIASNRASAVRLAPTHAKGGGVTTPSDYDMHASACAVDQIHVGTETAEGERAQNAEHSAQFTR